MEDYTRTKNGRFAKGHNHPSGNLGKKISEETRKRMISAQAPRTKNKKRICLNCNKIFERAFYLKGRYCTRQCAGMSMRGTPTWNKGLKGFGAGKTHHWYGRNMSGENNPTYLKDRSLLQRYNNDAKYRRSSAYNTWRKQVWLRDNYKCKIANPDCKGRLEAHHILGWKEHPELRYDINNGITLCHFHHPRARKEEKRLIPTFQELVSVSKILN